MPVPRMIRIIRFMGPSRHLLAKLEKSVSGFDGESARPFLAIITNLFSETPCNAYSAIHFALEDQTIDFTDIVTP